MSHDHVQADLIPADAWRRVLAVMERLAASRDLSEVLALIVDSLRDCLNAERASVLQFDPTTRELFATSAHGIDASLRFPADRGLAGEAIRARAVINVPDCYADPRFNPDIDRATGFHTRCLLTIPLFSLDGGLEGVAQVLNKRSGTGILPVSSSAPTFTIADETIARALASQAAIALRRATLLEAERRKNLIEAELRAAREIQRAALPASLPVIPGYDAAAHVIPADHTGGDAFDLVALPFDTAQPARLFLLLAADAAGHGIGPALAVTQAQSMVRMGVRLGAPLAEILNSLNLQLQQSLPVGCFIAAIIGVLDAKAHGFDFVSAGYAPLLILRHDGRIEQRHADCFALGIDPVLDITSPGPIRLDSGDCLVVLSDGYIETVDPAGRSFGVEGVIAAIAEPLRAGASAAAVLANLDAALDRFRAGRAVHDDRTAIVLIRRAP